MTYVASTDDVAVGAFRQRLKNTAPALDRNPNPAALRTCERMEGNDVIGKMAVPMDHHVNPKKNMIRK